MKRRGEMEARNMRRRQALEFRARRARRRHVRPARPRTGYPVDTSAGVPPLSGLMAALLMARSAKSR